MNFKEVSSKVNFPDLEKRIIGFWEENKVLEKYLKKNEKSSKKFSFLDGPITANNPMGVHHAWGRTLKDFYQRYKSMKGFKERFQNGFDNQGLWVEVEVEKKLGFKTKKDIETFGIDKFVDKCKEHTLHFAKVQTEQSKRLGYFMDWENSYYTLSDENNYAIWHFLKTCHEKGWLYKGKDVVPWCPRCGTAISQHETLTGDYAELTHKAVYLKYPVLGKKEYLLVWTTTPWTLLANVAIAVNPEITYVRVKTEDGILILAKTRINVIKGDYQILEELPGSKLLGFKYTGPYDELEIVKKSLTEHLVVAWKEGVIETEGTGLVHMSPGSGPEDYDLAKEIGLPVFPVLDEAGQYLEGYAGFSGKKAVEIGPLVIEDLSKRDFVYKTEDFIHRYPLCWRCKTELVFRLVDEWYIRMDELRERMIEVAKKIKWIPEFGLKLELDWLKNMEDWLISKKRYWGLCLPIWECECGHFEVIGSKKELKERAIEGWPELEGKSPHRPWVDKIKIKCPQCQKLISRISDVGNPWLDAGIVSFSTLKYFEDKDYWQQWFPADLVLESFPGQFKNWFYSLLAMAAALENARPFKTLLGHALVRDEKGREMHKSWGNAIEFNEAAEKVGADTLRWLYLRQNPTFNLGFGWGLAESIQKQFLLIFWNCYKFFVDYAQLKFKTKEELTSLENKQSENILDKWIISRFYRLLKKIEDRIDNYDHSTAMLAIEDFVVNDFSTWYIRRSRNRIGPSATDGKDELDCYATIYQLIAALTKVLAPCLPFLTEEIWQNLNAKDSIHVQDWPEMKEGSINTNLEEKMILVRQICSLGNAARKEAGIKTRQPLQKLKMQSEKLKTIDEGLLSLIRDELNVKEIELVDAIKEELSWITKTEGEMKVSLSTEITPALMQEGLLRDFMREIQEKRKKAGLKPQDKIIIYYQGAQNQSQFLEKNREKILKEVIASDLILAANEKFVPQDEVRLGQEKFLLRIEKV